MLFSTLSANWKLAAFSNKILLVANTALAIAVAVLAGLATMNRERITVMPPTIDKPYTVGWNSATPEYYKSMALYFSGVIGMTGPKNLSYVTNVIDRFAAPAVAEGIKTKMRLVASSYEFRNSTASSWFEGKDLIWEESTRKIFVTGAIRAITATKQEYAQTVVYEYVIDIIEGKPLISHFDSYFGETPHTQIWAADPTRVQKDVERKAEAERDTRRQMGETTEEQSASNKLPGGAK